MTPPLDQLAVRAATIDERLSDDFEVFTGQKGDTDAAARRLAAWCRAAASGDWVLFDRRLGRDGLSLAEVLSRLATVRRAPEAPPPAWLADAEWIDAALAVEVPETGGGDRKGEEALAFEHLFAAVADQAETRLWSSLPAATAGVLTESGRRSLRRGLVVQLSELCSAALFERFKPAGTVASSYRCFVDDMRRGGWRHLFEQKPVLLRLVATLVRQWIGAAHELVARLHDDLPLLRGELLQTAAESRVACVEADLSDPHNGGRSVQVLVFEDGGRVVYKPKDLRLDAAWQVLVERLNRCGPPVDLRAVRTLARNGYGWTEFVGHAACADRAGVDRFFRRAGAWIALFHVFASTDMHDENMIADGDHPVPVDLEMILQATAPEHESDMPERQAFDQAARRISDSVMMTGLLPAYGRSPENELQELGGLVARDGSARTRAWHDLNSDTMRRATTEQPLKRRNNLPHVGGARARLGDHVDAVIEGYETYAVFLRRLRDGFDGRLLFDGFAGLPVRKVVRPTRFYYLLMQRLRDHRTMDDGATWSAQADFVARLADWNRSDDPLWPLQAAERAALLTLNVPHFVSPTDEDAISSVDGVSIRTGAVPGLARARAQFANLDGSGIEWQTEVIRQSVAAATRPAVSGLSGRLAGLRGQGDRTAFRAEADAVFDHLSACALRSGPGAAWLGLDWLGDSDVSQLVPLGYDLYSGSLGIALFCAAYGRVAANACARDLALAAIGSLRKDLHSPTAARLARGLGTGAASGLGSVVYGLTTIAGFLGDDDVLSDATAAARLFSDDLIAADKALDVMSGNAGAILGLLRLHRATGAADVLARAVQCGDHLLAQPRHGSDDLRCWVGQGRGSGPLNGMSHGAAGFAHALAGLATASGEARFAAAARDCIAFENASFSAEHGNWPDLRGLSGKRGTAWTCQWCHGATGIGLARLGMLHAGAGESADMLALRQDVDRALSCATTSWPPSTDTLCCGTLGTVEFLSAAGQGDLAAGKLAAVVAAAARNGDYSFVGGSRQFNLGLFRGMAGVGYTLLRQVDRSLPNVLLWE
jgi:type 2 lantibiotic biosynthesis protein LanM